MRYDRRARLSAYVLEVCGRHTYVTYAYVYVVVQCSTVNSDSVDRGRQTRPGLLGQGPEPTAFEGPLALIMQFFEGVDWALVGMECKATEQWAAVTVKQYRTTYEPYAGQYPATDHDFTKCMGLCVFPLLVPPLRTVRGCQKTKRYAQL